MVFITWKLAFIRSIWQDILEVIKSDSFSFDSTGIDIPGEPLDNLCVKAYELLSQDFELSPVSFHLHKIVPIGAGLGGGSSDAAFALKMLNKLFDLSIDDDQLEEYAAQLGSDCPFFIQNTSVFATGRGEVFEPIKVSLASKNIVLVKPDIHISTKEAYAGINPKRPEVSVKQVIENHPISEWKDVLHNDFEDSIFPNHPKIAEIKNELYEMGAVYAAMSGSGSTIYGIFEEAQNLKDRFKGCEVWQGVLS